MKPETVTYTFILLALSSGLAILRLYKPLFIFITSNRRPAINLDRRRPPPFHRLQSKSYNHNCNCCRRFGMPITQTRRQFLSGMIASFPELMVGPVAVIHDTFTLIVKAIQQALWPRRSLNATSASGNEQVVSDFVTFDCAPLEICLPFSSISTSRHKTFPARAQQPNSTTRHWTAPHMHF